MLLPPLLARTSVDAPGLRPLPPLVYLALVDVNRDPHSPPRVVNVVTEPELSDVEAGDLYRLRQAQQLLRAAGWVELPNGEWVPPDEAGPR